MRVLVLTSVFLLLALDQPPEVLHGKAVAITDGDTFTLLTSEKREIKIRLAEIDAPESRDPYSDMSKKTLADLILGKDVRVVVQTVDIFGRSVGRPYLSDMDICAEMIRVGAARVYREYLVEEALLSIESEAMAERRGLWRLEDQVPQSPVNGNTQAGECLIKGNINRERVRIYHVPGSRSYDATRIDTSKGERWFCSEAEAVAAGWRAPKN